MAIPTEKSTRSLLGIREQKMRFAVPYNTRNRPFHLRKEEPSKVVRQGNPAVPVSAMLYIDEA